MYNDGNKNTKSLKLKFHIFTHIISRLEKYIYAYILFAYLLSPSGKLKSFNLPKPPLASRQRLSIND